MCVYVKVECRRCWGCVVVCLLWVCIILQTKKADDENRKTKVFCWIDWLKERKRKTKSDKGFYEKKKEWPKKFRETYVFINDGGGKKENLRTYADNFS